MLSQPVLDALNDQINTELSSSYAYLAMSAYCEQRHLHGFAKWLHSQSQEEYGHGMKLYDFVIARNGNVVLKAIPEPKGDFESVNAIFDAALEQEISVSRKINALYELALKEKAFAELVELQWFIAEQVEEEHTMRDLTSKLRMVKDDPSALLDLDREMAQRE